MGKLAELWIEHFTGAGADDWWSRKKELLAKRGATIVRLKGNGHVFQKLVYDRKIEYHYMLHLSFFIKQREYFYEEEMIIPYLLLIENGKMVKHEKIHSPHKPPQSMVIEQNRYSSLIDRQSSSYDRLAAVKYAEHWWNSYNPAYQTFDVDCTNYVSQCLRAGGAPMYGSPNRSNGWWYTGNNWSFSWAVAHSLRWYLSGSTAGLLGKEVESAMDLYPGDVICYDFSGDGRWDHTTIVTAKDAAGMPLVNAHTNNSRHRYWSYEDSAAWTPHIQYKFFQIGVG